MTDAETDAILKSAEECVESECSVEDITAFLTELKETESALEKRLEKIMNMIAQLQHVNEKEERKTDEVRQFVKDMLRVFSSEVCTDVVWLVVRFSFATSGVCLA